MIEQFRAGGEIDGMRRDRLVLLTTVGAKSGQRRTTPMMFHRNGDAQQAYPFFADHEASTVRVIPVVILRA